MANKKKVKPKVNQKAKKKKETKKTLAKASKKKTLKEKEKNKKKIVAKSEKNSTKKNTDKPVKKNNKKSTAKASKKKTLKEKEKNKKKIVAKSEKNSTKKNTDKPVKKNNKKSTAKATKEIVKKTKGVVAKKDEITKKKEEKEKKTVSKPKSKKEYVEDEDLLVDGNLREDDEEDVTEVEEIDISNIEPVISDDEPLLEDEEEYIPKTRGRKKQVQPEIHHHQQTLEEIIRNRPLQIDPTKKVYVTKKEDEPQPYLSNKSNKERYSDKELQEFKGIILQRLKETKENYDQLKKYFTNEDDNGIDDTSPTFKMIEDGSGVMTKEEIEQQLSRLEKYMIDLQNALLRIENKTYGICTVTGKLIPKERLRSVPHATKSIEAKISRDN